jgi:hypothetical protein
VKRNSLHDSRALWNRRRLDLESDETLAQIMDLGEIGAWRELYVSASRDEQLRDRMHRIVLTVPIAFPGFWLACLDSLGANADYEALRRIEEQPT